jgi:PAP2 superfamily
MMARKTSLLIFVVSLATGMTGACAGMEEEPELGEELAPGGGSSPSGETIVRWNNNNFTILTTLDSGAAAGLQLIRELAMVHIAMHDAANGAQRKYKRYVLTQSDSGADPALAAAAAAHAALLELRPGKSAQIDAFLAPDLARVSDANKRQRSLDLGAAAAEAILAAREDDGFFDTVPYTFGPPAPGVWQPVPPGGAPVGPHFPSVTPFALSSGSQFRAPPPPALSSSRWKNAYNQVKEFGRSNSTVRSADQTHSALFWREQTQFAWNRIGRIAANDRDKGLWQTARVFALLNMGLFDGMIASFDTKYHYEYWRPYTAIREVDDGRSDTVMDPNWQSLNSTPPHPEYNSSTGVMGASASYPLTKLYGNLDFEMSTSTADPPGSTRSFDSFSHAAIDSALSRIWAGIHFEFSCVPGNVQGLAVGKFIYDHELRPD